MKRTIVVRTLFAVLVACAVAAFSAHPARAATSTAGSGGTISISSTSLTGGKIIVRVSTAAPASPYSGFHLHLLFDGTLLSASPSGFASGGVLNSIGNPVSCSATVADGGGGITGGCMAIGPFSLVQAAGALANITLTPLGPGCSQLHLFTLNGSDGGDDTTGSFTINSTGGLPQANTYGADREVDTATGWRACRRRPRRRPRPRPPTHRPQRTRLRRRRPTPRRPRRRIRRGRRTRLRRRRPGPRRAHPQPVLRARPWPVRPAPPRLLPRPTRLLGPAARPDRA